MNITGATRDKVEETPLRCDEGESGPRLGSSGQAANGGRPLTRGKWACWFAWTLRSEMGDFAAEVIRSFFPGAIVRWSHGASLSSPLGPLAFASFPCFAAASLLSCVATCSSVKMWPVENHLAHVLLFPPSATGVIFPHRTTWTALFHFPAKESLFNAPIPKKNYATSVIWK